MKQVKCRTCDEKIEASTSRKIENLQTAHWKKTGHRGYEPIKGMGKGGMVLPENPKKPVPIPSERREWTPDPIIKRHADTPPAAGLTVEELEARLVSLASKMDLASMRKQHPTHHEFDILRNTTTKQLQAVERIAYEARDKALEKAPEKSHEEILRDLRAFSQRMDGLKEVTDRFKRVERDGFQDPRVTRMTQQVEAIEETLDYAAASAKSLHERLSNVERAILTRWPGDLPLVPTEPGANIRVFEVDLEKERAEEAQEIADARPEPEIQSPNKALDEFYKLLAENLAKNRSELIAAGKALGLPGAYCSAVLTVGLFEEWLKEKPLKDGSVGRPKKAVIWQGGR